ncbi:MAG: hypothetical protein JST83_13080 [Bacteroidetes bacterium]|nr:hypothetical protein [Bacteroidota bacterium]
MDLLNQIVDKLNKEELRKFRLLSEYGDNTAERKDLILLDYMRSSGEKFDEEKAIKKLAYTDASKNRYYQLKNRLMENIGDSLVLLNTHKDPLYEVHQYLQLSHIYRSRHLLKVAHSYLRKAEKCAKATESYEMLDVIYSEYIRLSSDMPEIDPDEYIRRREQNADVVTDLREMDNALAALSYRLRRSQNIVTVDQSLMKTLQAKVKAVSSRTTSDFGKNLEARIYNALSKIFLQQHNYEALAKLAIDTFQKFEKERWFDKDNHELKLQVLTYAANALFKNQKYKESLSYAERLGTEINAYDKFLYEKYLFFHRSLLVYNYAFVEPSKALPVIDALEADMKRRNSTAYDFYIYLNRATLLYDMGRYKESLKSLVRLYISDGYRSADAAFRLKIEVSELIITFESGDRETLAYRLKQVNKTAADLEGDKSLQREFKILSLLTDMNHSPDYRRDAQIQRKAASLWAAENTLDREDSEIIKYNLWLAKHFRNASFKSKYLKQK